MQTQLSSIFDPYNLYAKAFPGISFLVLVLSLLPGGTIPSNLGNSGSLVAAFVLLIIVFGFIFGQAVHSISVFIESRVYTAFREYYEILAEIRQGNSMAEEDSEELQGIWYLELIFRVVLPLIVLIASAYVTGNYIMLIAFLLGGLTSVAFALFGPVQTLRNWLHSVLTPHRDLFSEKLEQSDRPAEFFNEYTSETFDWTDRDDPDSIYVASMSYLEFNNAGRARVFQAIFSFSRSMWVVLYFFGLCFLIISAEFRFPEWVPSDLAGFVTTVSSYQATVYTIFPQKSEVGLFGILLIVMGGLFMYSEGQYKMAFTEYVLVDCLVLMQSDNLED